MKLATTVASIAAVATLGFGASAHAVVSYQANVDTYDSVDTDLITGNGNQINNFVKDNANGVSVAVKPRNRDISFAGQPNSIANNNTYYVTPGQSLNNPARPQLVFDYQFDPGTDNTTNFRLQIDLDYNPAAGAATFYTLNQPIHAVGANNSWDDTDGYYTNGGTNNAAAPTAHAWTTGDPYVVSNTTNLSFLPQVASPAGLAFPYNSLAAGEYEIRLTAFDESGNQLAQAIAYAVVPEPTTLAALAGAGVLGLRRRRA